MTSTAEAPRAYIEIAGSLYNPDWEFRENATGMRLSGMRMFGDHFRLRATFNTIDTDFVDLPVRGIRGLPFRDWREVGAGYVLPLGERTTLEAEVSYQGVKLFGKIESGGAILTGISHRFNERFAAALKLSYFELQTSDWRLTGELHTAIGRRTDLVTRIDDTGQFDFTWYEIGLRFRF